MEVIEYFSEWNLYKMQMLRFAVGGIYWVNSVLHPDGLNISVLDWQQSGRRVPQ